MSESTNTIKAIRRILPGDSFTNRVANGSGEGYYRDAATEPGFHVTLADCVVFLADSLLERAKLERDASTEVERQGMMLVSVGD